MIDEYVHRLDRALYGPRRLKRDLLTEARHSLIDSAEAYRCGGLPPTEAERRAVAEFGSVGQLAGVYQAELAASAARVLTGRVVGVWLLFLAGADLTWRGAPWTGPRPPSAYLLLSGSVSWLWVGSGLLAVGGHLWLRWNARRGPGAPVAGVRVVGRALATALVISGSAGIGLFTWSLLLWDQARTWPPMIVGVLVVGVAYCWLGRAVRTCLIAAR
nr:permease prefix domain 1-containing protein [Micromonospora sp. DSM 115978]